MDQQFVENLIQTLRNVTAPDTEAIQQASQALQTDFYKSPVIVPALVHILQTNPDKNIRQLAGVEARKLINFRWADLKDDVKAQTKASLLQTTIAEPDSLVRHTSSRVISSIAKQELDDNAWPDLLPALSTSANSSNAAEREVAVYILYTLLEADLAVLTDYITDLVSLFARTINDPESLQVRVSTIMALGEISSILSSFQGNDGQESEIFRSTIPSMVEVLKQVIQANDEKSVSQIFEVFSFLLIADSNLTSQYFADLNNFILNEIAAQSQLSEEFRVPALQYLINAVRSKKVKIQSLKLGPHMVSTAMAIIADYYRENEEDLDDDDDDDINETNPATLSFQLIDTMSTTLPPLQVNAPLLTQFSEYVKSSDPALVRAGFMSLAYAAEGAPDFFAAQISAILPLVVFGLQNPNLHIQSAALFCLFYLGCELRDVISDEHETLLPLVFNIIDNASNIKIGKNACQALNSILECMDRKVITEKYMSTLVPKMLHLFTVIDNLSLKSLVINAISSAAYSAGKNFLPYFEETMKILDPYIALAHNIESLPEAQANLCGTALDTTGSIAASVGKEKFQPFVEPLVDAAYKCMQSNHSRVKESGFICVGTLAKIYGHDFAVVVPKIVEQIYKCLDQNEFSHFEDDSENIGMETDENAIMENLDTSSAIAMEKEYATDTLGDLIESAKQDFPDIKRAISYLISQTQYYFEGLRKASITALWRAYLTWVSLDNEGKWTPGLPATEHTNEITAYIATEIRKDIFELLEGEEDRDVAILICQRLAEGLKIIGPRVLLNEQNLEMLITQILSILTKQHCSQTAFEDEVPEDDEFEESSEYDAVLIDAAFDVVVQIAACLGPQFTQLFPSFAAPILKFTSSQSANERAAAIGTIAEVINGMGTEVSGYTKDLLETLLKALGDRDIEVRSNAAYGLGLLCFFSEDVDTIKAAYPTILSKLQRLLKKVDKATAKFKASEGSNEEGEEDNNARCLSNACGCVARMILKHPGNVPVADVVSVLLSRLPLTDGLEENTPVFELIVELVKSQEPTVISQRETLVKILAQVFEQEVSAKDELTSHTTGIQDIELPFETDEIRAKVIEMLKFLETNQPGLVSSHAVFSQVLA
ncbi:uncharacterized protein SAPINGB_P000261 [Magnusiomyces paraingens]|uniref:Importin N-terminal domain-containing protein n=1 Tax=Magnusiomyces paraingens TaxID=2606893 RepID=A0A5E8AZ23_9ASCO|nr:uncharacterized protein SAPINGB_P000261 [Saprochaete ingens]VVT44018.1 unnamed protein product [Saprochaete ingens]